MGKASAYVPYQCACKVHNGLSDAAVVHEVAGQDEKRDGDHGEVVRGDEHLLRQNGKGYPGCQDVGYGSKSCGVCHRYADQHTAEKDDDHQCQHGQDSFPSVSVLRSAAMCSTRFRTT